MEQLKEPPIGSLTARPESSLAWDNARHALIEGDNLDALHLLRASLTGAAHLIYVDPPYNNQRDLIYRDATHAGDMRGALVAEQSVPASSQSPRERWLSALLPRLTLARELLHEEGLIFLSIDDQELPTVRLLMDEIFGAEQRLATFIWETKRAARGVPPRSMVMSTHEYLLCYGRDQRCARLAGLPRDAGDFHNPDNDPRGPWRSENITSTGRGGRQFSIVDPESGRSFEGRWAFSPERIAAMLEEGLILFPRRANGVPRQKKLLSSYRNPRKAGTSMLGWHSTEQATKALMRLFDGEKIFSYPKPQSLLRHILEQSCAADDEALVLDLFAGSGSLAQAVIEHNRAAGSALRSLSLQRPEPFNPERPSEAAAGRLCATLGVPATISALTGERIRRVIMRRGTEALGAGEGLRSFQITRNPESAPPSLFADRTPTGENTDP